MASTSSMNAQQVEEGTSGDADRALAHAVRTALRGTATVPHERLWVTVTDRWVTLKGTVDRWSQREAAERVVRRLAGVRGCLSAITVRGARLPRTRDKQSAPRRWHNKQSVSTP